MPSSFGVGVPGEEQRVQDMAYNETLACYDTAVSDLKLD